MIWLEEKQRVLSRNSGELASVSCSILRKLHNLGKGTQFASQPLLKNHQNHPYVAHGDMGIFHALGSVRAT